VDYKDIFSDIVSHAGDFKKAIEIAKQHAEVRDPDLDDKAYWDKQLKTYERIEHVAKLIIGGDEFEPVGNTNRERFESLYDHAHAKIQAFEAITGVHDANFKIQSLTAAEQMALALGNLYYQVCNGGIQQYIDNGYSSETGVINVSAASLISRFSTLTADVDEEVSAAIKACADAANKHADLNEYSEERFDRTIAIFDPLEKALYALDNERIFEYFLGSIQCLEPSSRPFIKGLVVNEPVASLTP
jgi:hypothetical protein